MTTEQLDMIVRRSAATYYTAKRALFHARHGHTVDPDIPALTREVNDALREYEWAKRDQQRAVAAAKVNGESK
jgi:hypothetical protein